MTASRQEIRGRKKRKRERKGGRERPGEYALFVGGNGAMVVG